MENFFDLSLTLDLLRYDFVWQMLIAGAVLGVVAGLLGPLVVTRKMAFAVHGTSELAFTGGAAALLVGVGVGYGALAGSVVAALLLGLLSRRDSDRDSVIGAILAFGLGLGVLFLYLYKGRSANKFGLLTGQIVSVGSTDLWLLIGSSVAVLVVLAVIYRPLHFASVDPAVATARGVPVRSLAVVFAVLVGVATALSVQVVGALLVLSLMITPAAAASRVTASPVKATALAVVFAEAAVLLGILLSLAPGVPVSAFVTGVSFLIYLVCRVLGGARSRADA
ncbi:metal ABC transporter permease [Saccharothrix algeriensis]|uniref:Metal ABC transporter permease n=1 Tax=Saccharothrix algeriensis TaxID=173560 RepID=A0A8T8I3Y9_9PSEU|nr:metal ABC transporter permease [Saccharothrix algeriensis]MBM7811807.1 zinc/manganese transport system permease protein [Saccharothrix algeriensis]QTR05545.1 metal ABC transporter permease [Saccharothrix algeriensis]